MRESIKAVIIALFHLKILVPLVLFFAVVGCAILLPHNVGLWRLSLWKPTVLWVLTSGIGMFFKLTEAKDHPSFFRDALRQTIGISVFVEFVANLQSFSLWVEIVTQMLGTLLILAKSASRNETYHATIAKITDSYISLLVVSAIIWTVLSIKWATVSIDLLLGVCRI